GDGRVFRRRNLPNELQGAVVIADGALDAREHQTRFRTRIELGASASGAERLSPRSVANERLAERGVDFGAPLVFLRCFSQHGERPQALALALQPFGPGEQGGDLRVRSVARVG